MSAASIAALTAETRLADGTAAGELFQWSRYGLGVGLDDFLGEPVVLHSGHSGVGFARFPKRRLSIVVFTNLEHPVGSDPVSLALGVAGLLEPKLALATRKPDAANAAKAPELERLEPIYDALTGARPLDLALFAPAYRAHAWAGAPGLTGRARRLGSRTRLALVDEGTLDGQRTALVRGDYASGSLYVRFSLDATGLVTRIVWWHL